MRLNSLGALMLVGALTTGLAAPALATQAYECEFQEKASNKGWIPGIVVIAWESSPQEAFANDPIIDHYMGGPVAAKLATDNTRRTTWSWEVKASSKTNQSTRMLYRVTVMKADMSASISATPQGFDGNFQSAGRCRKVTG